jgi:hypothetical protein
MLASLNLLFLNRRSGDIFKDRYQIQDAKPLGKGSFGQVSNQNAVPVLPAQSPLCAHPSTLPPPLIPAAATHAHSVLMLCRLLACLLTCTRLLVREPLMSCDCVPPRLCACTTQ